MSTYLENLTDEELCKKLEDDEFITLNIINEAVRRLRLYSEERDNAATSN